MTDSVRPTEAEIRTGLSKRFPGNNALADVVLRFLQTVPDQELSARQNWRGLASLQSRFVMFLRDSCNFRQLGTRVDGRRATRRNLTQLAEQLTTVGDAGRTFAATQVVFSSKIIQMGGGLTVAELLRAQPDLLLPISLTFGRGR